MGLIHQAISKNVPLTQSAVQTKKKNGLLGRIVFNSPYDCLIRSFLDLLDTAQCEKGFLLFPGEDYYQVLVQKGFDFTSCVRMMPDISNLNEMCHEASSWNHFSGRDLRLFAPYFSTRERNSLDSLSLYPLHIHDQTFWLLLVQSRLSITRSPFAFSDLDMEPLQRVLKDNSALLSALSIRDVPAGYSATEQEKMSAAFSERRTALLVSVNFSRLFPDPVIIETDFTENVLYRALANRIIRQAGPASIVRKDEDYSLRILIFVAGGTDPDLYLDQMKKTLERHFGASRIARFDISSEGTCQNPDYARDYISGVH